MKTLVTSLRSWAIALVLVLAGLSSQAAGNETASLFQAGMQKTSRTDAYKIAFINPDAERVTLAVYNDKGREIYTRVLGSEESYSKIYTFSQLPSGTYTVKMKTPVSGVVYVETVQVP